METKAILFDFMGVLLFKKNGYQPNTVIDEIDDLIGKVTDDNEFKKNILLKYHLSDNEFNNILNQIVDKYEPLSDIWNQLNNLRQKYKIAIINNGTALTLPKFKEKYDLDNKFDFFISSAIEGIKKPSPKIYLIATNRLGVKPQECLFMDDSKANIEAAKKLGMKVIWWKNKKSGLNKFTKWLDY